MSDAGLAHFQTARTEDLSWPQVTDGGLAHFKDCKNSDARSFLAANEGERRGPGPLQGHASEAVVD